jgi:hypothetical protein
MTLKPIPPAGPPPDDGAEDRAAFEAMSETSLEQTRESAVRWRDALAALSALIVGAILFKGREDLAGIETEWKLAITGCVVLGLGCLIGGLVAASTAAYAQPTSITHGEIRTQFGDVLGYRTALAARAARKLTRARMLVLTGLPLLIIAGMAIWWAPEAERSDLVEVVSRRPDGEMRVVCGPLESWRPLSVAGLAIAAGEVVSLRTVASC